MHLSCLPYPAQRFPFTTVFAGGKARELCRIDREASNYIFYCMKSNFKTLMINSMTFR